MYHLELRQFPHNACRFNLTEAQLRPIVEPWAREQFVEMGERKWSPHQARLTILEGPELEPPQLAMGRGWRAAQREGEDVTERVLAAAREAIEAARAQSSARAGGSGAGAELRDRTPPRGAAGDVADPMSVAMQVAGLLGPDAPALLEAWRAATASSPGLAPSETLALAETTLRAQTADGR
jgi:hypothetical protein